MRYLIDYANRDTVTRLIDQAMAFDIVHGVVVQLHPRWLALWRLSHSMPGDDWRAVDRRFQEAMDMQRHLHLAFGISTPLQFDWQAAPWVPDFQPRFSPVPIDTKWTCGTWELLVSLGPRPRPEPFLVTVLVLPRSSPGAFEELASVLGESTERIRIETRPLARAFLKRRGVLRPLQGGVSLGTDAADSATLGGILKDGKGARYALTCGHAVSKKDVVKQPSPQDSSKAQRIGTCVESTAGTLTGPHTRCTRKTAVNDIDAALIRLDTNPAIASKLEVLNIGAIAACAPADDIAEDAPVQISGRSGHRHLYTGGLFAIGSIRIGTDRYCFRNLMEIKRASAANWGVTGTLAPPARPGDSGAWIIQDGPNGPEWCGMIIGGTGPIAYAVFAETILDWLTGLKYSLTVA
jgi:hypothetical protein